MLCGCLLDPCRIDFDQLVVLFQHVAKDTAFFALGESFSEVVEILCGAGLYYGADDGSGALAPAVRCRKLADHAAGDAPALQGGSGPGAGVAVISLQKLQEGEK